jgi:CRP-like cAMP-binding protein
MPSIRKGCLMLSAPHSPRQNHLIASLRTADYQRLLPSLELLPLPLGWSVYETGDQQNHAYFPTDGIISLVYGTESGNLTEVAVTGNEGLVGIPLLTGGETTPGRAMVRNPGFAYRLKYAVLIQEFENGGPLQDLLLRYTQSLMTQIAQNAVCNRYHNVEQRLCRWLLMSFDRLPSNQLATTQELIASMLGVRREGVTEAARNLQAAGLISYSRGHITILDRLKLEEWTCECYAVVKRETDRLLHRKPDFSSKAGYSSSGKRPRNHSPETFNPVNH